MPNTPKNSFSLWTTYEVMPTLPRNIDLQLNVQNLTNETCHDKAFPTHFANQAPDGTALRTTHFHFQVDA